MGLQVKGEGLSWVIQSECLSYIDEGLVTIMLLLVHDWSFLQNLCQMALIPAGLSHEVSLLLGPKCI